MSDISNYFLNLFKPEIMAKDGININLNQNLWLLLISISALAASEYYCLGITKIFSIIICTMSTISMLCTLTAYTINYVREKLCKDNSAK